MKKAICVFFWLFLAMCPPVWGADVQLAWDIPKIAGTAGFVLHYGEQSRSYTYRVDVGVSTSYTVTGLQVDVPYFFALSAYGEGGVSLFSDELTVQIDSSNRILSLSTVNERQGQTSWWYDPTANGAGISIEVVDGVLFMGWYFYEPDSGKDVWLSSGGTMSDPFHYGGDLLRWQGRPPGETYEVPTQDIVGTISVEFLSNNEADVTYALGQDSKETHIVRFLNDDTTAGQANVNVTGWWYGQELTGMGAFVETVGQTIFMAWYNYRSDSTPRWWTSSGQLDTDAMWYEGDLWEWKNGPCLECASSLQPEPVPTRVGSMAIGFLNNGQAILYWNNLEFNLQRFLPLNSSLP